jgi:U4/U6.U5 tri-snRNP component SNU23
MSANPETEAVDNIGRRKWDMSVYDKKQKDRLANEAQELRGENDKRLIVPVKREALKRREWEVDLMKTVGKRQIVSSSADLSLQGGYYCDVCECLLKDSSTYLSHINGRRHQRKLGMSMKAERSTITGVKERLAHHKRVRDEKAADIRGVEDRLAEYDADLRKKKRAKKKAKKAAAKKAEDEKETEELTEEQKMMMAMGININFGGSKKN